jgi:hypothetical protein
MRFRFAKSAPILVLGVAFLAGGDVMLALTGWWIAKTPLAIPFAAETDPQPLPELADASAPSGMQSVEANKSEALRRPAFFPSRRPYQPPAPEPPAVAAAPIERAAPLDRILAGVFIKPDNRRAPLSRPNDTTDQWFVEGETIDGWRLVAVEFDRAVPEAGNERVTLEL